MPKVKIEAQYVGQGVDKGLENLQKEMAETAIAAGKLDSALGKKLPSAAGKGATALTDFSRIIQDAPFGIVGISNNITQLGDSFGRLKAETGSTKGAMKALLGSLTGGGGIGLAISAITSALTFASVGFGAWTRGFSDSNKAIDETAKSLKEYNKSLKDSETSALASGVKLQSFVDIARNTDLSLKQRNEALKEANKIMGEHGEKLTLLNVSTQAVTESIRKFTEATVQQALATRFAERAAELIIKQRDASKAYGAELDILLKKQKEFDKSFSSNAGSESEAAAARLQQGARALEDQKKNATSAAQAYKEITRELQDITAQLGAAQVAASGLFGELGTKGKEESAVKNVKTIQGVINELAAEIDFLNSKELVFGTNEVPAKIAAVKAAINSLLKDFNVAPDDALINKLLTGGTIFNPVMGKNVPGLRGLESRIKEELIKETPKTPTTINVPVNIEPGIANDPIKKITDDISAQTQQLATDIGVAFGSAVGQGIATGSQFLSTALESIMGIVGDFLIQLGRAAIAQSALIKAIQAANPVVGLAAGIAAVVAGNILKNIKLPKFATGGTFAGGGTFLAGERGPELITAPSGTVITPNAQTNAILGSGGGMGGEVVFRIGDRELIGILRRGNDRLGRNGQL